MSAPAADETLPERLILKLSRGYAFLMWLSSLAFVAAGFYLVHQPRDRADVFWGWAGLIFFGLCAAVFTLELIAPRLAFIELTREGFRMASLLRRSPGITPWKDIASIDVYRWRSSRGFTSHYGVRFHYVSPSQLRPSTIRTPRIYGWGASELVALMNRFRDRALQADALSR